MERDRRRRTRLGGSARRLLSTAVLCTASIWWLAATVAQAATAPTNDGGLPTISGTAQQGDVLTASPGGWSGDAPIAFSYLWSDGQSGSTITLSAADVGQSVTVTVTASNDSGQSSATSASVGPVLSAPPAPGVPPVITGTVQQGNTLSVSNGTWSNNPTAFNYTWEDCDGSGNNCVAITGAMSSGYTLQASDVGGTIVASVTASNAGGQTSSSSAATAAVLPAAPAIGTAPGISGTAQQGHTLTVSNGTWSNNPTTFAYAWQDCSRPGTTCSAIAGATSTHPLKASDVGHYVSVTVTASNSGGQTAVTTASVGPVLPPPPANTQPPAITATRGTLSVSKGTWTNNPTAYSYAWESCDASGAGCSAISGATSSSYSLSAADIGSTIASVVTATGLGGSTSVTAAKTAVVDASDIPAASQPTTTDLLATPSAPVTNQSVTLIRSLVVNGISPGAEVVVNCQGHGCPFAKRATVMTQGKRCGKPKRSCRTSGTLNLTPSFTGRHLAVGARITVSIIRPNWVASPTASRSGPAARPACRSARSRWLDDRRIQDLAGEGSSWGMTSPINSSSVLLDSLKVMSPVGK